MVEGAHHDDLTLPRPEERDPTHPGPTLRTVTLGCKVNQYETEYLTQGLARLGYRAAAEGEPAELCLVNTCTVTAEGDAKSRQTIRQLARRNPGTRIVVLGCYATRAPDEVARLPGVVEVLTDKRELPDWLARAGVRDVPTGLSHYGGRTRAFVKVQDGCLLRCSFCIIPHVRPELRSRPAEEIVAEVGRLAAAGHREIVLTGIHLGHYGVDLNRGLPKPRWVRLSHLVERLAALPGDFRLRLSSIEAAEVTHELMDVLAAAGERVCPHLHISLQSGSDAVLARMRRRGGSQRFIDRCRLAQRALDQPALTTDVIVGFPGETEADFAATCDVAREVGFSKLHVFPYSPRAGTPAATMTAQVPAEVKQDRLRRLTTLEAELRANYAASLRERRLVVLIEGQRSPELPWVQGTSCRYLPTRLPRAAGVRGQLVACRAGAWQGEILAGELLDEGDARAVSHNL